MKRSMGRLSRMANLQKEAREGQEAKALLESPVLLAYFEGVRTNLINEIGGNANLSAEGVKSLQMWLIHLNKLEQHLQTYVETGELARIQIDQEAA